MLTNPTKIDQKDKKWLHLVTLLFILLTSYPYICAYLISNQDNIFVGTLNLWPEDYLYHLSWVKQTSSGDFLVEDKYNGNEIQTRLVINGLFIEAGILCRALDISLPAVFHLVRILSLIAFVWIYFYFLGFFFESRRLKWYALLLSCCASDFGWVYMALGLKTYTDFAITEPITFLSFKQEFIVPPLLVATLLSYIYVLKSAQTLLYKYAIYAGIWCLLVSLIHPHDVFIILPVSAVYFFLYGWHNKFTKENFKVLLKILIIISLFPAPKIAYDYYILTQEPIFWDYVQLIDSLDGLFIPLVGSIFILAIVAILKLYREKCLYPMLFCTVWLLLMLILFHTPISPFKQYYIIHGFLLPCSIITVHWFFGEHPQALFSPEKWQIFIALLLFSSITHFFYAVEEWHIINKREYPYFISSSLEKAFTAIDKPEYRYQNVLAPVKQAIFIPYFCGARVWGAQYEQTANFIVKKDYIKKFYQYLPTASRYSIREFLLRNKIDILWVELEKMPNKSRLRQFTFLQLIHQDSKRCIYKVIKNENQ